MSMKLDVRTVVDYLNSDEICFVLPETVRGGEFFKKGSMVAVDICEKSKTLKFKVNVEINKRLSPVTYTSDVYNFKSIDKLVSKLLPNINVFKL